MKQERCALRVKVGQISSEILDEHTLRVSFSLPAGAYVTVLLAQLGEFESGGHN